MRDNNEDDPLDNVRELLDDLGMEGLQGRLDDLEDQLGSLQDTSGDNPFSGNPFSRDSPFEDLLQQTEEQAERRLVSEVEERDDEVAVLVDLPEFSDDQIEITATEDKVRVEAEATDQMYHDSVTQVFNLPAEVEPDEGDAEYNEGFLVLRFPTDDDDQTSITIE